MPATTMRRGPCGRHWSINSAKNNAAKRNESRLHIVAAETDVGAIDLGRFVKFDEFAIRREHADAAAHQCRDADVSALLERQRVEALIAGKTVQQPAAVGRRPRHFLHTAFADDGKAPEAAGLGFGNVERPAIRRQPDAVRRHDRIDRFLDQRAVSPRIVDRAAVHQPAVPRSSHQTESDRMRAGASPSLLRMNRPAKIAAIPAM